MIGGYLKMLIDPRSFSNFVATTEFRVIMAVAGGGFATFLGVMATHRFNWIYPCIGIAVGLGAAFLIQWVVRSVVDRL